MKILCLFGTTTPKYGDLADERVFCPRGCISATVKEDQQGRWLRKGTEEDSGVFADRTVKRCRASDGSLKVISFVDTAGWRLLACFCCVIC